MKRLFQLSLALIIGLLMFSSCGKGNGEKYFSALLMDRAEVTDLEAFSRDGSSYEVHLRFSAGQDWVNRLSYEGFVDVDCSRVASVMAFSISRIATWPLWQPQKITQPRCFNRRGSNELSDNGRDAIMADSDGGWVYAHFRGVNINRNLPDELR